jgi:hypothetical protein
MEEGGTLLSSTRQSTSYIAAGLDAEEQRRPVSLLGKFITALLKLDSSEYTHIPGKILAGSTQSTADGRGCCL